MGGRRSRIVVPIVKGRGAPVGSKPPHYLKIAESTFSRSIPAIASILLTERTQRKLLYRGFVVEITVDFSHEAAAACRRAATMFTEGREPCGVPERWTKVGPRRVHCNTIVVTP